MTLPVVTLLTDFGHRDPYVGIMKGQILRFCPQVQLVDLTHEIPAQDVRTASFHLEQSVGYFPPDTIHLAVVDPGVGGARAMVAVKTASATFIAPDNGILTRVLANFETAEQIVQLPVPGSASSTFHGRDVMAPVAGRLARGDSFSQLGNVMQALQKLEFPPAKLDANILEASVLAIDHFGNVTLDLALEAEPDLLIPGTFWNLEKTKIPMMRTYADTALGAPLLLWGSQGLLELALRQGSAADHFKLTVGQRVSFRR